MTHFTGDPPDDHFEDEDPYPPAEGGRMSFWMTVLVSVVVLGSATVWYYGKELGLTPQASVEPAPQRDASIKRFPIKFDDLTFAVPEPNFRRIGRNAESQIRTIELAVPWPPPAIAFLASEAKPAGELSLREGLFLTVQRRTGRLTPGEKLENIYPVYFDGEEDDGPDGLTRHAFQDGSVYEGQELLATPGGEPAAYYLCFLEDASLAPALCRGERHVWGKFTVVYRFHRSYLGDWRRIEGRLTQFLDELRS